MVNVYKRIPSFNESIPHSLLLLGHTHLRIQRHFSSSLFLTVAKTTRGSVHDKIHKTESLFDTKSSCRHRYSTDKILIVVLGYIYKYIYIDL